MERPKDHLPPNNMNAHQIFTAVASGDTARRGIAGERIQEAIRVVNLVMELGGRV